MFTRDLAAQIDEIAVSSEKLALIRKLRSANRTRSEIHPREGMAAQTPHLFSALRQIQAFRRAQKLSQHPPSA